jgi:hypothetical protein
MVTSFVRIGKDIFSKLLFDHAGLLVMAAFQTTTYEPLIFVRYEIESLLAQA